ncbi:LysR substrate-binding domain-containing protein [Kocuria rhizophila]|uniref:LysR family transcriptional regulator n=1 Tax=Kocuria TaxID=57493 RepID=UPI0002DB9217|nr:MULTISPECIES: LysR family transcriptional regulator [Kocuria]MCR4525844.1 LysR substrate-binding domain-containing protein [Kocuria rhizophila]MCT1546605.1 LysR substrate-binding domain-containing protein [Kocuria rhizophila]MCT2170597.1 LysR substrate-binding domain-containing protein [Kocuria rhizophila]MDN3461268.1 LysR substrate-binding domain-containing protein [Kocuria sp. APC 4018]WSY87760.1 LysR substrate-binding domain-containing protein [Kocuria rhizophila]
MLNVDRLRILAELSRLGTLTAVAETLSYSTSAVSQQLHQLEKDVGAALVERVGRRLVLTDQGTILAGHARTILADLERAEADVLAAASEPRGTVTVAAFQTVATTLVPAALGILRREHPGVEVVFRLGETDEALAALPGAGVDVVIAESYPGAVTPPTPGVVLVPLLEDPLRVAMSAERAALLDPGQDVLAQLADAAWAGEPQHTPPRAWLGEQCRRRGFEPRVTCVSEDLSVQAAFVAGGHAVAVLPELALGSAPEGIVTLPLGYPPPCRTITAAWRESARNHRAAQAVLEALGKVVQPTR